MSAWDFVKAGVSFEPLVSALSLNKGIDVATTTRRVLVLLHQVKNDLRLICTSPLFVGIDAGKVFDYFDQVRQIIEAAKADVLFIDPYIDAEFVSRYLPYVSSGTRIRILARERMSVLQPAVKCSVHRPAGLLKSVTAQISRPLSICGWPCKLPIWSFIFGRYEENTSYINSGHGCF
jgi:hypothetical protein